MFLFLGGWGHLYGVDDVGVDDVVCRYAKCFQIGFRCMLQVYFEA